MEPDFLDMFRALNAEGAKYLLVGAYAVGLHGVPRATGDIDFWVEPSADNAQRVWRALHRFGAPLYDLTIADLPEPQLDYQIGVEPLRIDVITSVDGLAFDDAWRERETRDYEDVAVPLISLQHLKINKRATGRAKDLGDADELEKYGD